MIPTCQDLEAVSRILTSFEGISEGREDKTPHFRSPIHGNAFYAVDNMRIREPLAYGGAISVYICYLGEIIKPTQAQVKLPLAENSSKKEAI